MRHVYLKGDHGDEKGSLSDCCDSADGQRLRSGYRGCSEEASDRLNFYENCPPVGRAVFASKEFLFYKGLHL